MKHRLLDTVVLTRDLPEHGEIGKLRETKLLGLLPLWIIGVYSVAIDDHRGVSASASRKSFARFLRVMTRQMFE